MRGSDLALDPIVVICLILAIIAVIWGVVFIRRPVVTLTPGAIVLANGRSIDWADIKTAQEGQETTVAPSQSSGSRSTTHEVVRLFHHSGEVTKIVTTWAKIGPQAANDKILAAFAQHNSG